MDDSMSARQMFDFPLTKSTIKDGPFEAKPSFFD